MDTRTQNEEKGDHESDYDGKEKMVVAVVVVVIAVSALPPLATAPQTATATATAATTATADDPMRWLSGSDVLHLTREIGRISTPPIMGKVTSIELASQLATRPLYIHRDVRRNVIRMDNNDDK